jgi:hypothetical protein
MGNKILLSSDEVCGIIEACGKARASELKFAGLYLRFDRSVETAGPYGLDQVDRVTSSPPEAEISEIQKTQAADSLVQDEILHKRERLSEMLITDPVEAERLLMQGELEDDGDSDDG